MTTSSARAAALAVALVATGCGRSSLPPQADPDEARGALRAALASWQSGAPADALAKGTPPVFFNDPRCRAGARLLGYTIDESHAVHGRSVRIAAVVSLKHPDGSTRDRKTNYLIDTAPAVVIVAE